MIWGEHRNDVSLSDVTPTSVNLEANGSRRGVTFPCWLLSVCLLKAFLVCSLSRRLISQIPRATAASQEWRFWCRSSWKGSRCRRRWPSSSERGLSLSHSLSPASFTLHRQVTMKTALLSFKRSVSSFWAQTSQPCTTQETRTWTGRCVKAFKVMKLSTSPSQDKDRRRIRQESLQALPDPSGRSGGGVSDRACSCE